MSTRGPLQCRTTPCRTPTVSCEKVLYCVNRQLTRIADGQSTELVNFCNAVSVCINDQLLSISLGQPTLLTNFGDAIEAYLKTLPGYVDVGDIFLSLSDDILLWQEGGGGGGTGTVTDVIGVDANGFLWNITTPTTTPTITLTTDVPDQAIMYSSNGAISGDASGSGIGAVRFTYDPSSGGNTGIVKLIQNTLLECGFYYEGYDYGWVQDSVVNTYDDPLGPFGFTSAASGYLLKNTYNNTIGQLYLGFPGNVFADNALLIATNSAGIMLTHINGYVSINKNYGFASETARFTSNDRLGLLTSTPVATLEIAGNSLGVTQDNTKGLTLSNSTAAAAGAQQISPSIVWKGYGWKTTATAASQSVEFRADVLPVQGTSAPTGLWRLMRSINGASFGEIFAVGNDAEIRVNGNVGTSGYVLSSQGSGAAATWVDPTTFFTLANGSATTASGSSVNLGGEATQDVEIGLASAAYKFTISKTLSSDRYFQIDETGGKPHTYVGSIDYATPNYLHFNSDSDETLLISPKFLIVDPSLAGASNGYVWTLIDNATGQGEWQVSSGGAGTVSDFIFTDGNGFDGTVTTSTTTPTLSLTTTVTNTQVMFSNSGAIAGSSQLTFTGQALQLASTNTTQSTTASIFATTANSLTTGTAHYIASSSLTSGNLMELVCTSTALSSGNELFSLVMSGANGTNAITATGARISVTNTNGTSGTNIGLAVTASGATTANIAIDATGSIRTNTLTSGRVVFVGTAGLLTDGSVFTNNGTTLNYAAASGTSAFQLTSQNGTYNMNQSIDNSANNVWNSAGGYFFRIGGNAMLTLSSTVAIFNDGAGNIDLRVEGQSDAQLIFADASVDRVGIGIALPTSKLHVHGAAQIGTAGTILGQILISGNTSGTCTIQPPAVAGSPTLTLPIVTGTITQYAETTEASNATPTPAGNAKDNYHDITALAAAATFAAPSGTASNHNTILIRIKDNGTARALNWNAIYRAGTDIALPTTTVINLTMYVQFIYNSTDVKWDLVGLTQGF